MGVMDPRIQQAMATPEGRAALSRWFAGVTASRFASEGGGSAGAYGYGRGMHSPLPSNYSPQSFAQEAGGAVEGYGSTIDPRINAAMQTAAGRDALTRWFIEMRRQQEMALLAQEASGSGGLYGYSAAPPTPMRQTLGIH